VAFFFLLVLLLLVPIPRTVSIPCEVRPESRAVLYAGTEGHIREVALIPGDAVKPGCVLFSLSNPFLDFDLREKEIERSILVEEIDQISSHPDLLHQRNMKRQQLESIHTILAEIRTRQARLELRAPFSGTGIRFDDRLNPGQWIEAGTALGEVIGGEHPILHGYLDEDSLRIAKPGQKIRIAFPYDIETISGTVVSVNEVPLQQMEPTPLQDIHGGPLAGIAQNGGWQSSKILYQVLIKPDNPIGIRNVGRSAVAEFRHAVTLGGTLGRHLIRFFEREKGF
jgi:hypothetical protein